jgi:eukaryotic-like serine/threonine-protein kinase
MSSTLLSPALQLEQIGVVNGWKILNKVARKSGATGGHFSANYVVIKDGRKAFLKAIDVAPAFSASDPIKALNEITEAFLHERSVLELCNTARLSKVVVAIEEGKVMVRNDDPLSLVPYIIFELATGDVRSKLTFDGSPAITWKLRALHQVGIALQQLHGQKVAHQDLKPSNVLVFESVEHKLADFGRSSCMTLSGPHDTFSCAGDMNYAPPELLYGFQHEEWKYRRFGCDAYLFGSLISSLFVGIPVTTLLLRRLPEIYWPDKFNGDYRDVLPFIKDALDQVIVNDIRPNLPFNYKSDLESVVRQLCNPDVGKRGHPKNVFRSDTSFSPERYISLFERLTKLSEISSRSLKAA